MSEEQFQKMIRSRARKHTGESFKFFWASFALQILVYALLGHVVIKYWGLAGVVAAIGILLYVPFTVMLMKKFKSLAVLKDASMNSYIEKQYSLLDSFYTFKKRYELLLIPAATLIGTFVTFEIWVPGSVWAYPQGAMITFVIALASCIIAIREENKKSFDVPLSKLKEVLNDLNA